MHLSKLNNREKEVSLLKTKLKRAHSVSKAVWEYRDYIEQIKEYIALEQITGASELWNELDYSVQRLLNTAPRFGGVFTTNERSIIKEFWDISTDDIEGIK